MLSVQVSLKQRRHLRTELQLEQTRWVLDAAIRKAIADTPEDTEEIELEPKLQKFDTVRVALSPNPDKGQVVVQAIIEDHAGVNLTSRSASFELED